MTLPCVWITYSCGVRLSVTPFIFRPCSKTDKATGLPLEVRQAMYGSRWDKVLVDCRRTVDYTTNGKKEVYTSMVAVGNMKVGGVDGAKWVGANDCVNGGYTGAS